MKPYFAKPVFIAGIVALMLPASLFAQKEKDKENKEGKNQTQQIVITRKGDADEKTVIEINGDKVKINGKDASDSKNENVSVQTHTWPNFDQGAFNFDFNNDFDNNRISLFAEDANRAMLGVVTDEDDKGAKITSITKESSADKAGLKVGDVITKIGDDEIGDADDVAKAVRKHKPGDKIAVSILRNGNEQKITAELGKWKGVRINNLNATIAPTEPIAPMAPFRSYTYSISGTPKLGLSVQDTDDGKGVKVLQVAEESNAAKAGVKKDDVITHINDEEVNGTDDVVRSMRENRNEALVRLQVLRNGKSQNIDVRIPRKLKTADL